MDGIRLLEENEYPNDKEYFCEAVCTNCDNYSRFAIGKKIRAIAIFLKTPCPVCECERVLEKACE